MARKLVDITGMRFGRLTVVGLSQEKLNTGGALWKTVCDCGVVSDKNGFRLRIGRVASCGKCRKRESEKEGYFIRQKYMRSAAGRGIPFELSIDEVDGLIHANCFYCGGKPSNHYKENTHPDGFYYQGIDRVDNSIGYTASNCVPCCSVCNSWKSNMTMQQWLQHIEQVFNNYIKKG